MSSENPPPDAQGVEFVPPPPQGLSVLRWVGPGIIWMVSAIATGELLFTPRISSLYGYTLLWVMIGAIFLKALIAREIGRYATVTGGSLVYGLRELPGPRNWGLWVLVAPGFFVAIFSIVGIAGATSSAIILALPGGFLFWGVVVIVASVALVYFGRYNAVEKAATVISVATTIALIITASAVFPPIGDLLAGLLPALPADVDFTEVLPWVGLMMSGAAGLTWYSHWLVARGFGASALTPDSDEPSDVTQYGDLDTARLKGWIRTVSIVTSIATVTIFLLLVALMVLGTELLQPLGLVPEGDAITEVLSRLLGEVWGPAGTWGLILAAFFSFWSTIIASLDGWHRLLGEGTAFFAEQFGATGRLKDPATYRRPFLLVLLGAVPVVLFVLNPQPVFFLILAGIIEVMQLPGLVLSVIFLNRRLPEAFRPGRLSIALMVVAGVFFAAFAAYYLILQLA